MSRHYTKNEQKIRLALQALTLNSDANDGYGQSGPYLAYETGVPISTTNRILRKLHARGELSRKLKQPEWQGRSYYVYRFANGSAPPILCAGCGQNFAHSGYRSVSEIPATP